MRSSNYKIPRPFLKWAGGKRQLLVDLMVETERAGLFKAYHEPFVGGGALYFELYRAGRLEHVKVQLSDTNERLIEAYWGVRDDVEAIIGLLIEHQEKHCKEHYYAVRGRVPENSVERAARIIYLNRTCYNGLYRENSKGVFNVPMGRYVHPTICDAENLRAVSVALRRVHVETRSFESVLDCAEPGDFVYFDPPYHPLSKTASFTAYAQGGFDEASQRRLAMVFRELDARGVKVLLSNSMTDFVRELYDGYHIRTVRANRHVNSKADRRGEIDEALVANF